MGQLTTKLPRHHDVGEENFDVVALIAGEAERVLDVGREQRLVAHTLEVLADAFTNFGVVFDQENAAAIGYGFVERDLASFGDRGQIDRERAACSDRALYPNGAAQSRHDAHAAGESEARTVLTFRGEERLEDPLL